MTNDREIFMGFMNLHDAFLNASLQRMFMLTSPVEEDANLFHASDRGRFERAWVTFLYVLVEAWCFEEMAAVQRHVASITPIENLQAMLTQAHQDGGLARMRETRNYMCHRDRREYWDDGRLAVLGQLEFHEALHAAFSDVFLAVFAAFEEGAN